MGSAYGLTFKTQESSAGADMYAAERSALSCNVKSQCRRFVSTKVPAIAEKISSVERPLVSSYLP